VLYGFSALGESIADVDSLFTVAIMSYFEI